MLDKFEFPDISPEQAVSLQKIYQERKEEEASKILKENKPYLILECTYVRTEHKKEVIKQTPLEKNTAKANELKAKIALKELEEDRNCVIV